MGVHRFPRALDDMERKLIDKHGHNVITDQVKIRKFCNTITDIIKKSITPYQTADMTYIDIVCN